MKKTNQQNRRKGHLINTLFFWTKKQKKGLSFDEKAEILEKALSRFFADHDKISNEVNLFPLTRASNEVKKMKREGTLEYHFEWFLLQQEYLRKVSELKNQFRKQSLKFACANR